MYVNLILCVCVCVYRCRSDDYKLNVGSTDESCTEKCEAIEIEAQVKKGEHIDFSEC